MVLHTRPHVFCHALALLLITACKPGSSMPGVPNSDNETNNPGIAEVNNVTTSATPTTVSTTTATTAAIDVTTTTAIDVTTTTTSVPTEQTGGTGMTPTAVSSLPQAVGQLVTLMGVSPGSTKNSILAQSNGVVAIQMVSKASADSDRRGATFWIRAGLADANCYSLESRVSPGNYLRQSDMHLQADKPDGSADFKSDATFCTRTGSAPGTVAWQSHRYPDRLLRQSGGSLYIAQNGGTEAADATAGYAEDTSWVVAAPWWRSEVDVPLGRLTLQVTTPGYTQWVVRTSDWQGWISMIGAGDPLAARREATFNVVRGLGDWSCYSFQSVATPTHHLRQSKHRVVLNLSTDPSPETFSDDTTFCTKPGRNGQGVTFQALKLSGYHLRHYGAALYVANPSGSELADNANLYNDDVSFLTVSPLAP